MTNNIIEQLEAIKQYCKKHSCDECEIRDFCQKYFSDIWSRDIDTIPMEWEIVVSKPLEVEE